MYLYSIKVWNGKDASQYTFYLEQNYLDNLNIFIW